MKSEKLEVAVYTAMCGDYDNINAPLFADEGYDYYFFTDNRSLEVPRPYKKVLVCESSDRWDKRHKIVVPNSLREKYKFVVWHDASMRQVGTLRRVVEGMSRGMAIPMHKTRNCITEELPAVAYYKKAPLDLINKQVQHYINDGLPIGLGLWEAGLIVREVGSEQVNKVCEDWLKEVNQWSLRDQISLPYVLWKNGYLPDMLPISSMRGVYFEMSAHK